MCSNDALRKDKRMTREEAINVLCANVMVACGRAGFDKATCQLVEDALDVAINALDEKHDETDFNEHYSGDDGNLIL